MHPVRFQKQDEQSILHPKKLFAKLITKTSCCLSSCHRVKINQDNPPSSFHFFWLITQSNERGRGAKDQAQIEVDD